MPAALRIEIKNDLTLDNTMDNHISLYSGAGGMDIGLEQSGFETVISIDNDKDCIATLKANKDVGTGRAIWESDVNSLRKNWDHAFFEFNAEATLVSGGPPCQSFSTVGKEKGLEDDRGQEINNYLNIVEIIKPRFFILENVRGMTYAKTAQGFSLVDDITLQAKIMGYSTSSGFLNALDYGSSQKRERFIMVGSRDNEFENGLDIKKLIKPTQEKYKTLYDSIWDIQNNPGEYIDYSSKRKELYKRVPPGKNWRWIRDSNEYSDEDLIEMMGGAFYQSGGKTGYWRRLSFDKPSPTLTTSPIQKATGLCHPVEDRPLSIKEYARIQGFPDDWKFEGTLASRYKQIGNAVPIELSKAIGTALQEIINKNGDRKE